MINKELRLSETLDTWPLIGSFSSRYGLVCVDSMSRSMQRKLIKRTWRRAGGQPSPSSPPNLHTPRSMPTFIIGNPCPSSVLVFDMTLVCRMADGAGDAPSRKRQTWVLHGTQSARASVPGRSTGKHYEALNAYKEDSFQHWPSRYRSEIHSHIVTSCISHWFSCHVRLIKIRAHHSAHALCMKLTEALHLGCTQPGVMLVPSSDASCLL